MATTSKSRRLAVTPKGMRNNLIVLYERLEKSERLRDSFISDPTGHISRRVMQKRLPRQQVSEANRLLFSLLANEKMVRWLKNYRQVSGRGKIDRQKFALDFAKQVQRLGDDNIMAGVIANAARGYGIPGLTNVAYQCVVNETPNKYDCACTPVSKDSIPADLGVRPELVRSMTRHLIRHATDLAAAGKLTDLTAEIL
jgi:hypothetical protein